MSDTVRIVLKMWLKISTFILAGAFVMGSLDEIEEMDSPWEKDYRIPNDIIPISYNLLMNPDIKAGNFTGEITALVNITAPRNWIPIHIKNLNISKTAVTDKAGKPVKVLETFKYLPFQFWVIKTDTIQPGLFNVYLNFTGSLIQSISGFYRSTYYVNGTSRSIAATKFEPVDARQAFPCFDEPALKAKFTIRIVRPREGYSALSNMNVQREEESPTPHKVTVHFAETVPMSTYLVCFIISDFVDSGEVTIDNAGRPFPVKIYSSPAQVSNTQFAKKVAAAVTKYYVEYFGIPYPLPKLDLVAIPDFVSGAMENWGLITFKETSLLHNEKENSVCSKQRVAVVVSHEISHQWFGNLVTMKWWDDLWLNEGFASFMQYKGLDEGVPECKDWQITDYAIYEQIHPVLKKDSLTSSHPIIQPVSNPNQINEIFDTISYNKGHAVIRMLENFLGEQIFKIGIQKYLKSREYSSASTVDLWTILNKEVHNVNVNVGEIMDTWTRQMGYPVITVEKAPDAWVLRQSRFLTDNTSSYDMSESPYKYKWDIPVAYLNDSSIPGFLWFKRNQKTVKIPRGATSGFVKLNHKQSGFYRVNYAGDTWKVFENILKSSHEMFDRKDRSNLLDDAFSLAEAGTIDYGIALDMVLYLKNEKDYLPWAVGATSLSELLDRLYVTPLYSGFKKFVGSLVKDKYGKKKGLFSFNVPSNDTHPQKFLRVKILDLACQAGYPPCLQDAGDKFLDWIKKPTVPLHPDVRSLVFQYGMTAVGKEHEWNIIWDRYLKEANPQEKLNLLLALSCSKEPWILSKLLQLAKNESHVKSQDYFQLLTYISMNPVGNPIVWMFFRNEWPYLVKRFSLYHRQMGTFIAIVTSRFSTQAELEEIEDFYRKYPDAGAGANARKVALERVRINKRWLEKCEASINRWLTKNNFL